MRVLSSCKEICYPPTITSPLSAYIMLCTTIMIVISGTYGMNDLKTDLQTMCNKADGVKGFSFSLGRGRALCPHLDTH